MSLSAKIINVPSELQEAKRVLQNEADALLALKEGLSHAFVDAVNLILETEGRVVVTGMGKSGHVARKISATLSSTGTPSLFVHPAEASHGDLGMISHQDTLIALSNSGETTELSDILGDSKRRRIPLIAMTSNPHSALASSADVTLILPKIEEACSLKLAPTTSTTMMMALGDALATTLLKKKQFSMEDFSALHPGGKLGHRLLTVRKIMHQEDELPLVPAHFLMKDVLITMTAKRFGCVGVLSDDTHQLIGMITDGDLRRHMSGDLLNQPAHLMMTRHPEVIRPQMLAQEALAIMNMKKITALFVVDDLNSFKPVGILHIHDCLRVGIL